MDFDAPRPVRRRLLKSLLAAGGFAWGLLPALVRAATGRDGFDAKALDPGLAAIGAQHARETGDIVLKAPDIAENSALVHVEIQSKLPDTTTIWLFAEKNPQPLVARFDLLPGLEPIVAVRIKMNESAFLRVVVQAGGQLYFTRRETKVTLGGCAG